MFCVVVCLCLGVLSRTELTEVLQEFISPHMGCDDLPQPWTHMTSSQVLHHTNTHNHSEMMSLFGFSENRINHKRNLNRETL